MKYEMFILFRLLNKPIKVNFRPGSASNITVYTRDAHFIRVAHIYTNLYMHAYIKSD